MISEIVCAFLSNPYDRQSKEGICCTYNASKVAEDEKVMIYRRNIQGNSLIT